MRQELTMTTVDNLTELEQVEGGNGLTCLKTTLEGAKWGSFFGPVGTFGGAFLTNMFAKSCMRPAY
jgi:hypothetical protein